MAKSGATIFWYDYETTGTNPQSDRIVQFAGLRTDEDLNVVDDPVSLYCKLSAECLPHPVACLVTGITPQIANAKGVIETEFCQRILKELSMPGTCTAGYNSIQFDDEFTRYLLYRNLRDPYAREWQNGNSRWDIIDLLRGAYALRPDGIQWPRREDGHASFKLQALTAANKISHEHAHDALSDVYATIEMAKLVQRYQPKFYHFAYSLRKKEQVARYLSVDNASPVIHVSSRYPAQYHNMAVVMPVAAHAVYKHAVIVFDLRHDPTEFLQLDIESLQQRLFTSQSDLPADTKRLPVQLIYGNKCPLLAPLNTLNEAVCKQAEFDIDTCQKHAETLTSNPGFARKLTQVFSPYKESAQVDAEFALYSGGFFNRDDRSSMEYIHTLSPDQLSSCTPHFNDERLIELFFRYRARNYPDSLSVDEQAQWREFQAARLSNNSGQPELSLQGYRQLIDELLADNQLTENDREILAQLKRYGQEVAECFPA